jgi:hypothetical protein
MSVTSLAYYKFDHFTDSFGLPPVPMPLYSILFKTHKSVKDTCTDLITGGERSPEIEKWFYGVESLITGNILSKPGSVSHEFIVFITRICFAQEDLISNKTIFQRARHKLYM